MLEQWSSGAVIIKSEGTVEQWHSDSKVWWNSGALIVKCEGTVVQWHSDSNVWWNSRTVAQ